MPTALFVQRDTAYHLIRRRLRGSMTREQWNRPEWRRAAIDKAWTAGADAVRKDDLEFVMPSPVSLYIAGGSFLCADIRLSPKHPHQYIMADGRPRSLAPIASMCTVYNTTYQQWAEGPLPHITLMAPTRTINADDRRAIDSLPNSALRERALAALSPTSFTAEAQDAPAMDDLVDFGLRGIFRTKDYTVLQSKQSSQGSKLVLGDGSMWDGGDDDTAPDDLLGD